MLRMPEYFDDPRLQGFCASGKMRGQNKMILRKRFGYNLDDMSLEALIIVVGCQYCRANQS